MVPELIVSETAAAPPRPAQSVRQDPLIAVNCDNLVWWIASQAPYVSTATGSANTAFLRLIIKVG
jgi:hypothetical protein